MVRRDPQLGGQREGLSIRGASGFSLAELLVVITIIAILAGILFPVLLQAKDTTRMRVCVSNLRQLSNAYRMYLDDNNGFGIPGPPLTADDPLPSSFLLRYTKEPALSPSNKNPKSIFVCPGDCAYGQEPPKWQSAYPYGPVASSYYYPYYAYTACIGHTDVLSNPGLANAPRRPDMWPRPSRDMLFCDMSASFHRGLKDGPKGAVKCVNFLMLDGHVTAGTRNDRMVGILYYADYYDNPYFPKFDPSR